MRVATFSMPRSKLNHPALRRCCLNCWRLPAKVCMALPDPDVCEDAAAFEAILMSMGSVLLSGLSELSFSHKDALVKYCMVKDNWARNAQAKKKRKRSGDDEAEDEGKAGRKLRNARLPQIACCCKMTGISRQNGSPKVRRRGSSTSSETITSSTQRARGVFAVFAKSPLPTKSCDADLWRSWRTSLFLCLPVRLSVDHCHCKERRLKSER